MEILLQARRLRCIAIALLAAAAVVLCGCASSPSSQGAGVAAILGSNSRKEAAALPGTPACFWLPNFDGSWTVLNDSELIVYAPLYSQPYLIKLFAPVPTLKFDEHLGFAASEHTGMICDDAMDELVVPRWEPHRVPIVAVHKLTMPQARQLLAENHIKLPPLAKPVKGNQATGH